MKRGKSYEGDHIRTLTSNSRGTCGNASGGAYCPGRGCGTYGCSTGEISGNQEDAVRMLDFLRGPRPLNGIDKQFLKDRFRGKEYLMRSFFAGSSPENNYTPSMPYRVVVSENPYSRSQLAEGYLTLYVNCSGADSPRPLKLRKNHLRDSGFCGNSSFLPGYGSLQQQIRGHKIPGV